MKPTAASIPTLLRAAIGLSVASLLILAGCISPQISQSAVQINVTIAVDGQQIPVQVASASTVQDAITAANLTLGALDKVEPPPYTLMSDGDNIRIVRVSEEFSTREETLPFERQSIRNETLPQGETRLIQNGTNGVLELTSRRVYEDGQLVSDSVVKTVIVTPAIPEIIMVGVQSPFVPLPIPGKLVYIAGGNAWLMEGSTANRRPLITTGDLDGRILKLSSDGSWLLYTRKSEKPAEEEINTLWVVNIEDPKATPVNLRTPNVIHYADWDPKTSLTVLYSTVEPRATAPGWQANNDLFRMRFGEKGALGAREKILEANTGGVYGWWGTDFAWSPDGRRMAYSRPDGVGLVSFQDKEIITVLEITPLQTHSDWALIPGLSWGADGNTLFVVTHPPSQGLGNPEESPYFDLNGLSLDSGADARLVQQSGMFAYPASSPAQLSEEGLEYSLAYLQALLPNQSDSSGYRLMTMDRDGSNKQALFPPPGSPGLSPQKPIWAPRPIGDPGALFIAIIYQGNLWLVDTRTQQAYQATGDGLMVKLDWK